MMINRAGLAGLAALTLAACGGATGEAAPKEIAEAEAGSTVVEADAPAPGEREGTGVEGNWRCKAQDNIPIGVLEVKASGDYAFKVVKNSLWDLKPDDPGNGKGQLGSEGELAKPLSGPLADEYEILTISRIDSSWGTKIYLNNDFGTLLVCTPESRGG